MATTGTFSAHGAGDTQTGTDFYGSLLFDKPGYGKIIHETQMPSGEWKIESEFSANASFRYSPGTSVSTRFRCADYAADVEWSLTAI